MSQADPEEPGTRGRYTIIAWGMLFNKLGSASVCTANFLGTDLYHNEYNIDVVLECPENKPLNTIQGITSVRGTTLVRQKNSSTPETRHCEIQMVDDNDFSVSVIWHLEKTPVDVTFYSQGPPCKKPRTGD